MGIELTALHWVYVLFIVLIIGFMVKRARYNPRMYCRYIPFSYYLHRKYRIIHKWHF